MNIKGGPQVTETIFNVKTYFSPFLLSEDPKWHFPHSVHFLLECQENGEFQIAIKTFYSSFGLKLLYFGIVLNQETNSEVHIFVGSI